MKNIYNITKGQLITLWCFGVIGWFMLESSYSDFAEFLSVFIPMILVFYTIGWKNSKGLVTGKVTFWKKMHDLRIFNLIKNSNPKVIYLFFMVIIVLSFGIFKLNDLRMTNLKKAEYVGFFKRYDQNLTNAKNCSDKKVEDYKESYLAICKSNYSAAYSSYKDCKEMYWKSHDQCLNWTGSSNYEAIDCSDDTIAKEIRKANFDSCYSEVSKSITFINNYEKDLIENFLASAPKTKASFSNKEMLKIYRMIPEDVFNDKTKIRINKIIEDRGYKIEDN